MNDIAVTEYAPIRLLLVDVDPIDRLACGRALEPFGPQFQLVEADTAEQGLALARRETFDCLIVDHCPPAFHGLEFLAELMEDRDMPVLLVGGNDPAAAMQAVRLGALDYLVKDAARETWTWVPTRVVRALREHRALRERREVLARLRTVEAQYRHLVEQLPAITYIASLEQPGRLLYVSPQAARLGYTPEAWLADPQGLLPYVHPQDRDRLLEQVTQTYGHLTPLSCEYRLVKRDGQVLWVRDQASVVRDEEGKALFLQGTLLDISECKALGRELARYRGQREDGAVRGQQVHAVPAADPGPVTGDTRYRQLLEAAGDGILGVDALGRCTFANRAALQLLGCGDEDLAGRRLLARIGDTVELRSDQDGPLARTLRDGVQSRFTDTVRYPDGRVAVVEFSAYPTHTEDGVNGAVLVLRDISETSALVEQLSYQASHDPLTGLLNRAEFERRLERVLSASRHHDAEQHTLCFLDLDRFKAVNDTLGHAAGDQLLQSLGLLFASRLRQSDLLARLGGDEFGLLLEHCPLEQARLIAEQLCEAARSFRFPWAGGDCSVGVSIGLVPLDRGSDVSTALHAADTACYIAKKLGGDRAHALDTRERPQPLPEAPAGQPWPPFRDAPAPPRWLTGAWLPAKA
ncbi:diguanylate cyclase domain-containing protein [Candidatus Methylocalor cossyra]|uniref:Diguanylate cyclase n=1 Tax=Candidatus Methylocalor cossyra TaxID=3108543 RepID=A0ABM9NKT9_9GAMM